MQNFVEIAQTTAEFSTFSRSRRPSSWIFEISNLLTIGTVKRIELHQRAKFRQNLSNRGRHMAIFRFFEDGGRPPSWISNACDVITHEGQLALFISAKIWLPHKLDGRKVCSQEHISLITNSFYK